MCVVSGVLVCFCGGLLPGCSLMTSGGFYGFWLVSFVTGFLVVWSAFVSLGFGLSGFGASGSGVGFAGEFFYSPSQFGVAARE